MIAHKTCFLTGPPIFLSVSRGVFRAFTYLLAEQKRPYFVYYLLGARAPQRTIRHREPVERTGVIGPSFCPKCSRDSSIFGVRVTSVPPLGRSTHPHKQKKEPSSILYGRVRKKIKPASDPPAHRPSRRRRCWILITPRTPPVPDQQGWAAQARQGKRLPGAGGGADPFAGPLMECADHLNRLPCLARSSAEGGGGGGDGDGAATGVHGEGGPAAAAGVGRVCAAFLVALCEEGQPNLGWKK